MESQKEKEILVSDLDLPERIVRKLNENEIYTAYEAKMGIVKSPFTVLRIRGVGKITVKKIKDALEKEGIEVKRDKFEDCPKLDLDELGLRNSFRLALIRAHINSIDELISYMDNGEIKRVRSIGQLAIKEMTDLLYDKGCISDSKKSLYYNRYKLGEKKLQNNAYVAFVDLKLGKYTYNAMYVKNDLVEDVYFKNRIPQGISKEKILKILRKELVKK